MNRYRVTVNGKEFDVLLHGKVHSTVKFEVEGAHFEVEVTPVLAPLQHRGAAPTIGSSSPAPAAPQRHHGSPDKISAPMPGIVVNVAVEIGSRVEAGASVCVIEAMKMENNIPAPRSGTVKEILITAGQEVDNGQVLIVLESE